MTLFIRAPQINVNDDQMVLVEWLKQAGARIQRGEALAVIETTKSTGELQAEGEGYLTIYVEGGNPIRVGEIIAALANLPQDKPEKPPAEAGDLMPSSRSGNRKWTKKALVLAESSRLNLTDVDSYLAAMGLATELVRESDVVAYLEQNWPAYLKMETENEGVEAAPPTGPPARLVIIGAGVAAAQVLDVLSRIQSQRPVGLLDDNPALHGKSLSGIPVLGSIERAEPLFKEGFFDQAVISIGTQVELRARLFERLQKTGILFANVIDPGARLLSHVKLGTGNIIMPFCQVAASTTVGDNNFLSAYVSLEHHNGLGSHCTFGPAVFTSGQVKIGNRVKFGAGIFVEPSLTIGDDSRIASGVTLTRSVPAGSLVKSRENFVVRSRETGNDPTDSSGGSE